MDKFLKKTIHELKTPIAALKSLKSEINNLEKETQLIFKKSIERLESIVDEINSNKSIKQFDVIFFSKSDIIISKIKNLCVKHKQTLLANSDFTKINPAQDLDTFFIIDEDISDQSITPKEFAKTLGFKGFKNIFYLDKSGSFKDINQAPLIGTPFKK